MSKRYTFLIIPHKSGKRPIEFNIHRWVIAASGVLFVASVLVFGGSMLYSAKMAKVSAKYNQLETRNLKILEKLDEYTEKTESLKGTIYSLRDRDQEIRHMLGLRPNNRYFPNDVKKKIVNSNDPLKVALNNLHNNLTFIESYTQSQNRSYENLSQTIVSLKHAFDQTPSIWPLYGMIAAGFGYRIHPITGQTEFHQGVDITAFVGAPVRATASGIVVQAGWDGAYGNKAMIDHHNGLRTVYAHLSRFIVHVGDRVQKGQLIALAGSTGLSTGPHVHYELHYHNTIINPVRYLNGDLITYANNLKKTM